LPKVAGNRTDCGVSKMELMPKPFSIAAAVVKILKMDPAPSLSSLAVCSSEVSFACAS